MKKYLIITSVGTSLFTNYTKKEVRDSFDDYEPIDSNFKYWEEKKLTAKEYNQPGHDFYSLEKIIDTEWLFGKRKIGQDWIEDEGIPNRYASAEITSILKIAEKIKTEDQGAQIKVKLLATDTALSVSAAKLISRFPFDQLNIQDFDSQKDYIPSLGVHPLEGQDKEQYYNEGLQQLVERLIGEKGMIEEAKKEKIKPVINFSGGYKAIIPFLTIIAQLEDIPMYYIYEESDYLMEVGSLPVNFDWMAVEALKPLLKNYILKEKLNPLAQILLQGLIEFKENTYQQKGDKPEVKSILDQLPSIVHRATHGLLSYKLVHLKNGQDFEVTPLGKIVSKVDVATDKGFMMEHLLFKYFSFGGQNDLLKDYQVKMSPIDNNTFGYKVVDTGKSEIEIIEAKPKGQENCVREIGDIDISLLKKDHTFVWAESKAYSTACDYHKKVGKDEDYYFQLKARAESLKEDFDAIELLLIVFRFVFKGINDNHFLDSKHFKTGLKRFEELNEDEDIKSFASFRCIGITIPIDFNKDRIDFTSFYMGNFNNWIFEELKATDHA